jgi:hypothetical protein
MSVIKYFPLAYLRGNDYNYSFLILFIRYKAPFIFSLIIGLSFNLKFIISNLFILLLDNGNKSALHIKANSNGGRKKWLFVHHQSKVSGKKLFVFDSKPLYSVFAPVFLN